MAQDHKWSIPMATLLPQFSAQFHVIEAQEREVTPQLLKPDAAPRGDSSYG